MRYCSQISQSQGRGKWRLLVSLGKQGIIKRYGDSAEVKRVVDMDGGNGYTIWIHWVIYVKTEKHMLDQDSGMIFWIGKVIKIKSQRTHLSQLQYSILALEWKAAIHKYVKLILIVVFWYTFNKAGGLNESQFASYYATP